MAPPLPVIVRKVLAVLPNVICCILVFVEVLVIASKVIDSNTLNTLQDLGILTIHKIRNRHQRSQNSFVSVTAVCVRTI